MYYDTRNKTFGHTPAGIARELNASFGAATLQVGPYRYYEQAPEPAYDAATQRIEPSDSITQRAGKPWLRGWNVIARTTEEIAAEQAKQAEREQAATIMDQARDHPLFAALQNADWPDIDGYINSTFPTLNNAQRDVLKLLTVVAQAVLKGRA